MVSFLKMLPFVVFATVLVLFLIPLLIAFYDKKIDAVYEVDWGEMDDFMAGRLKPIFSSFYDFLEWYYNEED
jgi:hypothetical protein